VNASRKVECRDELLSSVRNLVSEVRSLFGNRVRSFIVWHKRGSRKKIAREAKREKKKRETAKRVKLRSNSSETTRDRKVTSARQRVSMRL